MSWKTFSSPGTQLLLGCTPRDVESPRLLEIESSGGKERAEDLFELVGDGCSGQFCQFASMIPDMQSGHIYIYINDWYTYIYIYIYIVYGMCTHTYIVS